MNIIKTSKKFALDSKDFIKGTIVASLSAVGRILETAMTTGSFETVTLKAVGGAFAIGAGAYLIKNFWTGSTIKVKPDSGYEVVKKEDTVKIQEIIKPEDGTEPQK